MPIDDILQERSPQVYHAATGQQPQQRQPAVLADGGVETAMGRTAANVGNAFDGEIHLSPQEVQMWTQVAILLVLVGIYLKL